jgi:hypothetical protein
MKTPSEIRANFLKKAEPLIDEYVGASLGKSQLSSNDATARSEVWSLLRDILVNADDLKKVSASNTKSVLRLLRRGKITIDEAERLMRIMQTDFEVTELPALLEKFESLNK